MSNKGKIIIVSAPSGAGKTTILKGVLGEYPQLKMSVSATTRNKREEEIDGKDYFFISEDIFREKIDNEEFIEWEKFYDYYYGTLKSYVANTLEQGFSVVFEVDVKGALNLIKYYPDSVSIFIEPPSINSLVDRLTQRNTETKSDLEKRINRAEMELQHKHFFKYIVVNDNLELAKDRVRQIIDKELKNG